MRIWTTFTAIILIIICSISLLYLFAFRNINEKARMADLKVAHDILLSSGSSSPPNRLDELRNLKGSKHFILRIADNNTEIIDLNRRSGGLPPQAMGNASQSQPGGSDLAVKVWMTSFIKNDRLHEQQFKQSYNNMNYIFIISSIDGGAAGKAYLVSYIPNIYDNSLLYVVLIVGLIFIAIGFLTAKVVAGHISKPLKELEDYTVKIAHKDWKEPIEVKSKDEIGRLADSMNHMQKELKRADEEEKMFLQSISHDLKTPVMVIMSHADAIIDGIYIDSVEKTAGIIRDEAINLEKKIKQILYLNTLDYVLENNSEDTEVNFKELLLHITSRFEVVNSKIEWNLDLQDIMVNGNLDKVKVAIENILENGLRYAKEEISISLDKQENFAVLEIYNDGPNIDSKHIDHIFDNLYKDKTGNFGLGLAITKKIIDFYGGEIKAVNRENGVSFIIKYPILKEDNQQ
jgi:two-component system sensor histidine kinase CssS